MKIPKGFTLIELLITVGILALALTLTTGVLVSVVKSYNKQKTLMRIQNSGDMTLNIVKENLRRAVYVSCLNSSFEEVSCTSSFEGVVKITTSDSTKYIGRETASNCSDGVTQIGYVYLLSDPPEPVSYSFSDSSIITNDDALDGVNVDSLVFGFLSGSPERVSVTMTINEPCRSDGIEKVFQTLITLRGT